MVLGAGLKSGRDSATQDLFFSQSSGRLGNRGNWRDGKNGWDSSSGPETWRFLLPVPEVGEERDSTFPYWLWAPLPGGGVTLKNLAKKGELLCEARPEGTRRHILKIQARPSEVKMRSLVNSSSVLGQPTRAVWNHSKEVFTKEVALELGFKGWAVFQPQR